jgi:mono/diheme cytochrome c family protein
LEKKMTTWFQGIAALLILSGGAWAQDAKEVYLDKCAVCHGADGAGKTAKGRKLKVKDVHETAGKLSVEEMIKIVDAGKGKDMDAFGKELGKDKVTAVTEYYRSLAKQ